MKSKHTRIYQPVPWPVSPEPPAGRPGLPCFPPTQYLGSHSRHWPEAGLEKKIYIYIFVYMCVCYVYEQKQKSAPKK